MGKRLFVGNLPFKTTEDDLRALFAQDGCEVTEAKVVTDRDSGRSRGYAFVEMATDAGAQAAIAALHGHTLDGRALTVSEARERDPGGGGRRG